MLRHILGSVRVLFEYGPILIRCQVDFDVSEGSFPVLAVVLGQIGNNEYGNGSETELYR